MIFLLSYPDAKRDNRLRTIRSENAGKVFSPAMANTPCVITVWITPASDATTYARCHSFVCDSKDKVNNAFQKIMSNQLD